MFGLQQTQWLFPALISLVGIQIGALAFERNNFENQSRAPFPTMVKPAMPYYFTYVPSKFHN